MGPISGTILAGIAACLALHSSLAAPWPTAKPEQVGLVPARLTEFSDQLGGHGCVIRQGQLVHAWGEYDVARDVASACKPVFTHFLLSALAESLIPSLDQPLMDWEPRLRDLNPELNFKNRGVRWRHAIQQTSCYGLTEAPGTAFAYNDWQMALLADTLFGKVYGSTWEEVDHRVLGPRLTMRLGWEDKPTLLGFGSQNRPGRLKISPRDFARFGQLYLQGGRWGNDVILKEDLVRLATHSPLPPTLPRAGNQAAAMIPGQRSLGSTKIPDNQTDHFGSYSFTWWINGLDAANHHHWPNAPTDTFAALGHGGIRALVVIPSQGLVVSWNDAKIQSPADENRALLNLCAAIQSTAHDGSLLNAKTSRNSPSASANTGPPVIPSPVRAKRRVIIETDAGGDPDDEQSLIRFLLYANAWDVTGIIANRPQARDGENINPARTGLAIVQRLLDAYAACWTNLVSNDPAYPDPAVLRQKAVAGYDDTEAGVQCLIEAADAADPRPIWYSDWGSDRGSATNNLRRALDRILQTRGAEAYATFKSRFRLVSGDHFGPHTYQRPPAFPLWVDTWRPEMDGKRWYHRFSALTARAGGFDVVRDVLKDHGPLGALYPNNTTHPQKEGDTLSFLYYVPTGMDSPESPGWGGWGGRLGPRPIPFETPVDALKRFEGRYFWANQADTWKGTTHRDNTLLRWAEDLQNDFRARLDWCVQPRSTANHHPVPVSLPPQRINLVPGESRKVSAIWTDPDGEVLDYEWIHYDEAGTWHGDLKWSATGPELTVEAPRVEHLETVHFVLRVRDRGKPPLARYHRLVIGIDPQIAEWSTPPDAYLTPSTAYPSLLRFDDGKEVREASQWSARRKEISQYWNQALGPWPAVIENPKVEIVASQPKENYTQIQLRLQIAPDLTGPAYLLIPAGEGPFPAVLVVFYDPETSVGLKSERPNRDFARQLSRRGFVTLSIGTPGGNAWKPDLGSATCQPLAFHAYIAANAWQALAHRPEVDPQRIGVLGHSYGGKWALFAGAFWDRFAAVCVSDPGIVFDESRSNVNYWEPWYLGADSDRTRRPGIPSAENPRTGAYATLMSQGRDLHEVQSLIAPRPFLVSGGSEDPPERWRALNRVAEVYQLLGQSSKVGLTSRLGHDPTEASNAQIAAFFEFHLAPPPIPAP
ncbi:MAG: DUF1593 domain-containing protein [Verrucomicrobiales bacterium]|nr:DUF1593 domain-containing protein [Verrucomicrobiales bacterium]